MTESSGKRIIVKHLKQHMHVMNHSVNHMLWHVHFQNKKRNL